MTLATKTDSPMDASMGSLRDGRWAARKGSKCGRNSDSMKGLHSCGKLFTLLKVVQTSTYPSLALIPGLTECCSSSRAAHHIRHLLALIAQFPRVNPSADTAADLDIPKLFRQIRSRYKALCSTLGVKPSLRASEAQASSSDPDDNKESLEGPEGRQTIWKLTDDPQSRRSTSGQEHSF